MLKDVIKTLQFMKPDIQVTVYHLDPREAEIQKNAVWVNTSENDIYKVVYNYNETFRPTAEEIAAVNQDEVEAYWKAIEDAEKKQKIENVTKEDLLTRIKELEQQITDMI